MPHTKTELHLIEIKALAEKEAKEIVENRTNDEIIDHITNLEYELILYQNMNNFYKYRKGIASVTLNIPIFCDIIVDDTVKSLADEHFKGKIKNTINYLKDEIEFRNSKWMHFYNLSNDKIFEVLETIHPSRKISYNYKEDYLNILNHNLRYY